MPGSIAEMGVRFLELGSCGMASGWSLKGGGDGMGFGSG